MQFPQTLTPAELEAHEGEDIIFDLESFQNYFLAAFLLPSIDKIITFESSATHSFDPFQLSRVLNTFL